MSASTLLTPVLSNSLVERFAVARAVTVGRGALGLMAVLKCWRDKRDTARVAVPAAVCHEVLLAVLAAGCEPVFCDVDVADGLVSESEWSRARARGANAAIVVHLYGNPARTRRVREIFPAPDCLVIDDAAQALGAHDQGCLAGAQGDAGLLSFGATKQISVGSAAVLFHSEDFAAEVTELLRGIVPRPAHLRDALAKDFRARLDLARAELHSRGVAAAGQFAGLLQGLQGVLFADVGAGIEASVVQALDQYPETMARRIARAALWARCLEGSGLQPVGMQAGCVPWRYVCRLPGISWSVQHELAEALRASGMHVSNWYLPAHWFVGEPGDSLPGAARLAREVFQFWLDDTVTEESIAAQAAVVKLAVAQICRGGA